MSPNKKNLPDFSFFSEHQVNSSSSVIFFLTLTAMIYSQNDSVLTLIDHLERKQKLSIDADLYTVDKGKTMLQKLSVGEVFILKNLRFEERDGILKVIYDFFFFYPEFTISYSSSHEIVISLPPATSRMKLCRNSTTSNLSSAPSTVATSPVILLVSFLF